MEATLHYKSEKGQVTWAEFLVRANKMFTIYEENHDPKVNSYKVGWLCKALHAQHLQDVSEEVRKDRSRGHEWQYDELCNYIGARIKSHDKIITSGLGSRQIAVTNAKQVSFADHNSSQRHDYEKDFKFYMKNFRDQVPQTAWNKFTNKQQQIILEA